MDQFVFEILVIFVESLGLAHSDEPSMGKVLFSDFIVAIFDGAFRLSRWPKKVFRCALNLNQSQIIPSFIYLFFCCIKPAKQVECYVFLFILNII